MLVCLCVCVCVFRTSLHSSSPEILPRSGWRFNRMRLRIVSTPVCWVRGGTPGRRARRLCVRVTKPWEGEGAERDLDGPATTRCETGGEFYATLVLVRTGPFWVFPFSGRYGVRACAGSARSVGRLGFPLFRVDGPDAPLHAPESGRVQPESVSEHERKGARERMGCLLNICYILLNYSAHLKRRRESSTSV